MSSTEGSSEAAPTRLNPGLWADFWKQPTLYFGKRGLMRPGVKIFTMGSCFAAELRNALSRSGVSVYPDYRAVQLDAKNEIFNHIPERDSVEHYDTFVMRQEFEAALC